jgi:hypothetical protein
VKPWLKTLLTFVVVSAASVFGTLFVLILAAGGFRGPPKARVSFSEFLFLVEGGHVDEIHVDGREYTFVVVDESHRRTKTTLGPQTTLAEMQSVRPTDPAVAPPKVTVVGGR